ASYKSQNQTWEHEHCVGCWAKFMENGPTEALLAGYVTVDGDNWICPNCFDELHDEMDWTLIDP
ncbi:MAG TPA: hypothetical protein VFP96_05555, partial [Candidatus Acidoferrum sp.]|nr:hypothetical protein [Candidatus Acidoferrum sp.]